jgi:hypothetical protein
MKRAGVRRMVVILSQPGFPNQRKTENPVQNGSGSPVTHHGSGGDNGPHPATHLVSFRCAAINLPRNRMTGPGTTILSTMCTVMKFRHPGRSRRQPRGMGAGPAPHIVEWINGYTPGMEIVPDTKNWTWVLQRSCPECGLDSRQVRRENIALSLRDSAARWLAVLEHSDYIRKRPSPGVWSPLEYACHVRDVFRLYDMRLTRMLAEEDPLYPNWDQDETAVAERYGEQNPVSVSAELEEACEVLASRFEQVSGELWQRTGRRSDGARFTVETFGRYLVHDPIHHLFDVTGRRYGKGEGPSSGPFG